MLRDNDLQGIDKDLDRLEILVEALDDEDLSDEKRNEFCALAEEVIRKLKSMLADVMITTVTPGDVKEH